MRPLCQGCEDPTDYTYSFDLFQVAVIFVHFVLYDYTPHQPPGHQFAEGIETTVKKGDLVAILSNTDPMGQPSEWWRCRARDAQVGSLPSPYVEVIQRKFPPGQIAAKSHASSPAHSRVNTMTG